MKKITEQKNRKFIILKIQKLVQKQKNAKFHHMSKIDIKRKICARLQQNIKIIIIILVSLHIRRELFKFNQIEFGSLNSNSNIN